MWSNFHTHSHYCDGKGLIAEYLQAAVNSGVRYIGFSSHAPLPFPCKWCMKLAQLPHYLEGIESAKRSFPDIQIYKGLEVDFIPGIVSPQTFSSSLDYTVGSIHFVEQYDGKGWEIDNTEEVFLEGLDRIFNNDIRAAVTRYLQLTRAMLTTAPPDILGHVDKIKVNAANHSFDEGERWYRDEISATIKSIVDANIIVEVNTRGQYKKKSPTPYPSPWILEQLHKRKVRITISSDAHHPQDLIREFDATRKLLLDIGFTHTAVLKDGSWEQLPLNEYGIAQ